MAELQIVLNCPQQCKAFLEDALSVLRPKQSLSDIVDNQKLFKSETLTDNCPFTGYESISSAQLCIYLVNSYCQYLKIAGSNNSEIGKAISLSHDLRESSIVRYQQALDDFESFFALISTGEPNQAAELMACTRKEKSKAKRQRGKTSTKTEERTPELFLYKPSIASLVFLENFLKTHSLDGDIALKEGDYPRLLSNVQAGLDMVRWAQDIVSDPFLLDTMSTSLLHYLRGVAHVLASKDGFDCLRKAGCCPSPRQKAIDMDMSEIISNLDLSPAIDKPATRKKSGRGVEGVTDIYEDSFDEELLQNEISPIETKNCRRGVRDKMTSEPPTLFKKRPNSRKILKNVPQTPLAVETDKNLHDIELKSTKKSTRSSRKNTKSSRKAWESVKSNTLCDTEDFDFERDKRGERKRIHSTRKGKNSACDLVDQCNRIELDESNGTDALSEEGMCAVVRIEWFAFDLSSTTTT